MVMPSKQSVTNYSADAQKAAALLKKEKKAPRPTARQRRAIEAMVFDGAKRADAAKLAGLSDHALRQALTKPHTLAFLNECQEMLRNSLRPRALHKMGELLEAEAETVQFKAAEYLDGLNRGTHTVGGNTVNVQVNNTITATPGYVIDLTADSRESSRKIGNHAVDNAIPLSSLDDVPDDE